MRKKEFQHLNPSYARICINHKDDKNPVTMTYPSKKGAFRVVFNLMASMWSTLIQRILSVLIILGLILLVGQALYDGSIFEKNDTPFSWSSLNSEQTFSLNIFLILISASIFLSFLFIPPLIATIIIINNHNLLKKVPEWSMRYYVKQNKGFHSVRKYKLEEPIFEIPLFDNIFLDYKLTGDFKKYIHKLKIEEYQVDYRKVSQNGKKKKKTRQDSYWKATFTFTQTPKKGMLEVIFL